MDRIENELMVETIKKTALSDMLEHIEQITDIVVDNAQIEYDGDEAIVYVETGDLVKIKEQILNLVWQPNLEHLELEAKADLIRKYGD